MPAKQGGLDEGGHVLCLEQPQPGVCLPLGRVGRSLVFTAVVSAHLVNSISLSIEELDVVPETHSSSCVMWGMRWIVSSCQALPAWPCYLVFKGIMEQAAFSVPSCLRAWEGVATALTAELQMLSQG